MSDVLLFAPVLGAPLIHAPVLRFDLFAGLKRPLDGGRGWFGTNKTWRGALFMTAGPVIAALVLSLWPAWRGVLPEGLPPLYLGFACGVGLVIGELPNSWAKRRRGIPPGERGPIGFVVLDQFDFVPAIWVLLLPVYVMPVLSLLSAIVAVTAIHLVINVIGYAIGARTAPI